MRYYRYTSSQGDKSQVALQIEHFTGPLAHHPYSEPWKVSVRVHHPLIPRDGHMVPGLSHFIRSYNYRTNLVGSATWHWNHQSIPLVFLVPLAWGSMGATLPGFDFTITQDAVLQVEILNQAIKHRVHCFVFTSSIAVYGSINVPWLWKPFSIFIGSH